MRQCFLKGKYARARYVDQYHLLSPEFSEEEVFIQSTHMPRTIQSAYAHLMGLYSSAKPTPLTTEKINVPFKVRNLVEINAKLGSSALPHNFTSDYVVTFADRENIQGDI